MVEKQAPRLSEIFIKKRKEIEDFLIVVRESRFPFFGVQTVFAPLIDKLIERRQTYTAENAPPAKEQLLTGTTLIDLVSQGHFVLNPEHVTVNGEEKFWWNISSKPIPIFTDDEEPWIEEDMMIKWIHRTADDEGTECWGYLLTPAENEAATNIMNQWARSLA